MAKDKEFYFWTGGHLNVEKTVVSWPNGMEEEINKGSFPWSEKGLRGAQPDGIGTEHCLAVLNNIYDVITKNKHLEMEYLYCRTVSDSTM